MRKGKLEPEEVIWFVVAALIILLIIMIKR